MGRRRSKKYKTSSDAHQHEEDSDSYSSKKEHHESSSDEFSLDLSSISINTQSLKSLINTKWFQIAIIFFLLIIPLYTSYYIRKLPAELPAVDNFARQSVYNAVRAQLTNNLRAQYPQLPQQELERQVNAQLPQAINSQQAQIEQAIAQQAQALRAQFQDDQGYTYLGDIDSYFWARYAQNYLENGHIGDELVNGVPWDNHMLAPDGFGVTNNIYSYIIAYLHTIFIKFSPNIPIYVTAFYTPMILSIFAIVAAFFAARQLAGNAAGFIAAMMIATNTTILSRSLGSDNDIVNAVFPLIIMVFIFIAFDTRDRKKAIVYGLLAGFFTGFYHFAWSGWWFIFLLIFGAALSYMGYTFLKEWWGSKLKDPIKIIRSKRLTHLYLLFAVFFITTYIVYSIIANNFTSFFRIFLSPISITTIKEATRSGILPNVYTTVAELNSASIGQLVQAVGGKLAFFIGLMGALFHLFNFKKKETRLYNILFVIIVMLYCAVLVYSIQNLSIFQIVIFFSIPLGVGLLLSIYFNYDIEPMHSILAVAWFVVTIYGATRGVRFILLIIPAFVISFASAVGLFIKWTAELMESTSKQLYIPTKVILFIVIAFILFSPARSASSVNQGIGLASQYMPSVNDGWVSTLTAIKENSQDDAIINSWWDFGHWFKFWADRAVTFDGASQSDQRAHWIGKVLLTEDEDQAVSILRMLDCGGGNLFPMLFNYFDEHTAIELIYEYLAMDAQEIRNAMSAYATEEDIDKAINYLFCAPPENFFITSGDMVGKSGVWAHFGSWNFDRSLLYSLYKDVSYEEFISEAQAVLGYDVQQANTLYNEIASLTTDRQVNDWIAPWPSYLGQFNCDVRENRTTVCAINIGGQTAPLEIDPINHDAYINSSQGLLRPNRFGYIVDGEYNIKEYDENLLGFGIAYDQGMVVVMHEDLVGSMFTRMFYFNGAGLMHFNKFYDVRDVTGSRIITWEVIWPQ